MAKACPATGRTLDPVSLLASLSAHLLLAALVVFMAAGKTAVAPAVLEVSLVDLSPGHPDKPTGSPGPVVLPSSTSPTPPRRTSGSAISALPDRTPTGSSSRS